MKDKKIEQVYEIFIRTTPETLWRALIEAKFTEKYFFGTSVKTTAKKGDPISYTMEDGRLAVDGVVLEAVPPKRLVQTWVGHYDKKLEKETSIVRWEIEKRDDVCKLTVTHDLTDAPVLAGHVGMEGWSVVLSGLKTLLETGEPLVIKMAHENAA